MINSSSVLRDKVKKLAQKHHDNVVSWRRHIHQNPELSFKEFKTTEFISQTLLSLGITKIDQPTETGLVATIEGDLKGENRVQALRADIDALPIKQSSSASYKSTNEGVMHA